MQERCHFSAFLKKLLSCSELIVKVSQTIHTSAFKSSTYVVQDFEVSSDKLLLEASAQSRIGNLAIEG